MKRKTHFRWLLGWIVTLFLGPSVHSLFAQSGKSFIAWAPNSEDTLFVSSPTDTLFVQGSIFLENKGIMIHNNGVVVFTDTFQKNVGGATASYTARNDARLVFQGQKGYVRLPGDSARYLVVESPQWDDTLKFGRPFWVKKHIWLKKGRVLTHNSAPLVLDAREWNWALPIVGTNDSGYVIGPVDWYWDNTFYGASRTLLFPVGDDTAYRPVRLLFPKVWSPLPSVSPKRVRFVHIQGNPGGTPGIGIHQLSNRRYWKGTLVNGDWDLLYDSVKVSLGAGPDDTLLYGTTLSAWRIASDTQGTGIYNSLGGADHIPGRIAFITTKALINPLHGSGAQVFLALGTYGCKAGPIVASPTDRPCQGDTVQVKGTILAAEVPAIQWLYQWDSSATLYTGGNDTVEYAGTVWDTLYYFFVVKDTVNGCVPDTARITLFSQPSLKTNLLLVLEGAFNSAQNRMVPDSGFLEVLKKVYMPGTGYTSSIDSMYPGYTPLAVSGGDTVIDVIWVYLRGSLAGPNIDSAMAWLIEDGTIRDFKTATRPFVNFGCDASAGNYYVVVAHRNHLPVMSSGAIALSTDDNPAAIAFTNISNLYQDPMAYFPPLKQINTVHALYGGNVVDLPGEMPEVNAFDYFLTYSQNGILTGYAPEDTRLDGNVNANDYNLTSQNNDELYRTHVPNAPSPPRETISVPPN